MMQEAEQSLGEILGLALQSQGQARLIEFARYEAGRRLANEIAGASDLGRAEVWDALCSVPDNMLALLESPQGWSALAAYVAEDLGWALNSYAPTVH